MQTNPMFDPNDPRTMNRLSEEVSSGRSNMSCIFWLWIIDYVYLHESAPQMEKKLHIRGPFSLTWKTQKDGKVFQEVSQKKKAARKCN